MTQPIHDNLRLSESEQANVDDLIREPVRERPDSGGGSESADRPMRTFLPKSIRFQILIAVNGTFAVFLIVLLANEYRWEMAIRIAEKHAELQYKAALISESAARLRRLEAGAFQGYLDAVCSPVHRSNSPETHIAVQFGGAKLQASGHTSAEILAAMITAAESRSHVATLRDDELVVGAQVVDGMSVIVAESARATRGKALAETLWHLAFIAVLSIVATVMVNYLLLHMIDRPLRRLVATVAQMGRGQFAARTGEFKTAELTALGEAIDGMIVSLAEVEARRRAQLQKAREIQSHLLPRFSQLPRAQFERLYRPADDVSGDFYDVLPLKDGSVIVCIADVVGHGVPAAMTAAMLKVLLSEATRHRTSPAEVLAYLNLQFLEVAIPGDFVSLFLVRWKPEDKILEYASAGHGTSWFIPHLSPCQALESTGLLLGIERSATWTTKTLAVASGDRLLLATDGLTETSNGHELFGEHRVVFLLEQSASLSLGELTDIIDRTLVSFRGGAPQQDDLTLVLLEFA